jgi:hypothetical protein
MLVCLCFVDVLFYGHPVITDQSLANWSFQNQNERSMRLVLMA